MRIEFLSSAAATQTQPVRGMILLSEEEKKTKIYRQILIDSALTSRATNDEAFHESLADRHSIAPIAGIRGNFTAQIAIARAIR